MLSIAPSLTGSGRSHSSLMGLGAETFGSPFVWPSSVYLWTRDQSDHVEGRTETLLHTWLYYYIPISNFYLLFNEHINIKITTELMRAVYVFFNRSIWKFKNVKIIFSLVFNIFLL